MKIKKNKLRLKRSFMHRARRPAHRFHSRLAARDAVHESRFPMAEPAQVWVVDLDQAALQRLMGNGLWLDDDFAAEPDFMFVDNVAKLIVKQPDGRQHVLRIISRLQGIIHLVKWLKYSLFFNQAWFQFRALGKPSQGVSPPVEKTMQAA